MTLKGIIKKIARGQDHWECQTVQQAQQGSGYAKKVRSGHGQLLYLLQHNCKCNE